MTKLSSVEIYLTDWLTYWVPLYGACCSSLLWHNQCSQIAMSDVVFLFLELIGKVWVAKVRARTHTCDVRSHMCVCVQNPFWKVCGMCVRAALFGACDVRSHFCTLFETKLSENATFCFKNHSRTRMSYPVLEHPFLLWNVLSCFRSSYSVLEHLILF